MANLKLDLINKLNNEKYYDEIELIRLAQDPSMNYKEKIDLMQVKLETIALLNAELGLVEQYFKEPEAPPVAQAPPPQADAPAEQPAPQAKVQPGQSHGEG